MLHLYSDLDVFHVRKQTKVLMFQRTERSVISGNSNTQWQSIYVKVYKSLFWIPLLKLELHKDTSRSKLLFLTKVSSKLKVVLPVENRKAALWTWRGWLSPGSPTHILGKWLTNEKCFKEKEQRAGDRLPFDMDPAFNLSRWRICENVEKDKQWERQGVKREGCRI